MRGVTLDLDLDHSGTVCSSEKHYFYLETCWQQLYATLQNENIKLKVLEICSVSVRKDVVGAFSRCVMSGLQHLCS